MARERYDGEDEEDTGRGRGRQRDDDDDYDDRPRRRENLTGLDSFFNNIAVAILMALFGLCCCPLISIILGGIGMATCKNPTSKQNSLIVLLGGVAGIVLNIILMATGQMNQFIK